MTKLNQILAVSEGAKAQAAKERDAAYHTFQKGSLFVGQNRQYVPKDDEGDRLPDESVRVQARVPEVTSDLVVALARLINLEDVKNTGNTKASADIMIDETTIASNVPVTTLLFLEKQLVDFRTILTRIPVLDPADKWTYDDAALAYRGSPFTTNRTEKKLKVLVKHPGNDKHPAQTETYNADEIVGTWSTTKFSGAVPALAVKEALARVEKMLAAVKVAREAANMVPVVDSTLGNVVTEYVFGALR